MSDITILLFLELEVKSQIIILKLENSTKHLESDNSTFLATMPEEVPD
jgi:hypothetical protein